MRTHPVTKRWQLLCLAAALLLTGCTVSSTAGPTAPVSTQTDRSTPTAPALTAISPHTSTPTPATHTSTTDGTALATLHLLTIKGRAPMTGYRRSEFGDAWTDDVTVDGGHNGCDTRNDVLRRDLTAVVLKLGTRRCIAASGTLRDPYTGRLISFTRGANTSQAVQVDHVVALGDAWQTGAQNLSGPWRRNLANDPLELLAVDGPTNQSKGDGDAATWLPPVKAYRCSYVARQIAVKARYRLWVTPAEEQAMRNVLNACPQQGLPAETATDVPNIQRD